MNQVSGQCLFLQQVCAKPHSVSEGFRAIFCRPKVKTIVAAVLSLALTIQAKDFDVRDFGAKGDGKTLDTAAIQKALDACGGTAAAR